MSDTDLRTDLIRTLASDYQILREVPHPPGITAVAARSARDGQYVDIKAVPIGIFGTHGPPSEATLTPRRVSHPNIVPVTYARAAADVYYWISPSIDGRSLRTRLSRGGRMAVKDTLIVLRDVSSALTHAHMHGAVHGGLSPYSVLISGGSALVSDIGVSEVFDALRKHVASDDARMAAAEALKYASPEQGSGLPADARSDVYAWGVIAYELLGGQHPFAARTTPRQMMAAHKDEEPMQLTGLSNVPAAVTRLVMRCLSKEPSKRPESARQILDVLTKEMLGPPPAPKAGSGQKIMIGILLGAVAVIALITWFGIRP